MTMGYATQCKIDAELGFKSWSMCASFWLTFIAYFQYNNILFKLGAMLKNLFSHCSGSSG